MCMKDFIKCQLADKKSWIKKGSSNLICQQRGKVVKILIKVKEFKNFMTWIKKDK